VPDPDCIFCKVISGELPGEIVDSDARTVTVMDINPATRGHVVVIPRDHASDLVEVSDEDLVATMHAVRRIVARMRETLEPAGFNILNNVGRAAWLRLPWLPEPADPSELAAVAAQLRR